MFSPLPRGRLLLVLNSIWRLGLLSVHTHLPASRALGRFLGPRRGLMGRRSRERSPGHWRFSFS